MSVLKWEEPAPDRRGRGRWRAVATALRSRPGEWALIAEDAPSSTTTVIKQGRLADFRPAGSFEAVARGVTRNRGKIYARYVGEEGLR